MPVTFWMPMRSWIAAAIFCLALCAKLADAAQDAPQAQAQSEPPTLDAVLVTGEQPGPGLWKVSKDEHVLWILGAQYPLPKNITWKADEVEQAIAQSQVVLADASAKFELSFFHKLTLLPAVYGARKNADGATLKDVLAPPLYARWETLKAKYIGRDTGVERLRPMVAANELYDKALSKSGLARNGMIWERVRSVAKKDRVRIVEPEASIPLDDPKQAIRDFNATAGQGDADCMAAIMTRLETDLAAMRERANAWAVGDIEALKTLPAPSQQDTCRAALENNARLRDKLEAAMRQIDATWLAAAEGALRDNAVSFAVLPMDELLRPDRRLAMLRERGYRVEEPQ